MAKKVCILTSVHLAFDTRIFHKQAKTLTKAGYDVTLIARHDRDEVVDGIKIIALPKPRNRFWRMLGTWRVFRLALRQKADVYHFHDPELLPAGLLLKMMTKGRVIYDVHEDVPKDILTKRWLPSIARKPVAFLVDILEKKASSRLDYIVTATDNIRKNFKGLTKVVTINNYPILQEFRPTSISVPGQVIVIYTGLLCEERGISEIVRAMAYLKIFKNVKLRLYGVFDTANYQEKVTKLEGFERVEYFGWIKPEFLWQKISEAFIGIVCFHPDPNHVYAMPTKLFEYMAAGLPVIASDFALWKEIVEGNSCGLTVNPLNPEEIAGAITYLLDHPEEAKKMGDNGRRAVIEKYNWEKEGEKLLDLYQELTAKG
jgi:glycosyltransferase involved in cell wall biosynthesis